MELSARLKSVINLITPGNIVADIGCDHAYIPIFLIENKISPRAIAMDVKEGPLQRAREHVNQHKLGEYITLRLSDGTENLCENEADTLVCAGMGGKLIISILQADMKKIQTLKECILQPQSEIEAVRTFLYFNNLDIVQEDMVFEEGKFYPMMRVVPKLVESIPEKVELMYGKCLLADKHPVLFQYLNLQRDKFNDVLEDLLSKRVESQKVKTLKRAEEIKQELLHINKALESFIGE